MGKRKRKRMTAKEMREHELRVVRTDPEGFRRKMGDKLFRERFPEIAKELRKVKK